MLRNLTALYKYTYKFLTIFSVADANSMLNRKRLGHLENLDGLNCIHEALSIEQHGTKCNSVSGAITHKGKNGIPMLSLAIYLLFTGHMALFIIRKRI